MRYYKMLDDSGAVAYIGTGELGGVTIDKAEYEALRQEILSRPPVETDEMLLDATEDDFLSALAEFGVNA